MLKKNDVLMLRDLALSHLPKVLKQSEAAYIQGRNSKAALQVAAMAPDAIKANPLSGVVERQAAHLLQLVGTHPDTHTEWLNDEVDGDDFPGQLGALLVEDAQRSRRRIEEQLVEAALELCRLSGAVLPPPIANLVEKDAVLVDEAPAPTVPARTTESEITEKGLRKRERQIRAILIAVADLNYPPLCIPDGGKSVLMKKCKESWPELFGAGPDPFLGAWKAAVAQKRLRVENHELYAGK